MITKMPMKHIYEVITETTLNQNPGRVIKKFEGLNRQLAYFKYKIRLNGLPNLIKQVLAGGIDVSELVATGVLKSQYTPGGDLYRTIS